MNAEKLKQAILRIEKSIAAAVQREITDAMVDAEDLQTLLNALSERAVSPAESVQSIEYDADFALTISAYNDARAKRGKYDSHILPQWLDLVKLLDAKIAAAHAEGVKQERKEADDCARHQAAQIVELRKKVEEAHAEGRRSALEELHPQWLKEKERADRAEAKGVALERALNPLLWDKAMDAAWHKAIPNVQQAFADLRAAALLSSTAQPLQQEGEKVLARAIDCLEILNKRPRPMCRDCADEDGVCPHDGLDCDMRKLIADARAALSQPSDNLQQASTVQVEPAKKESQ